MPLGEIVTVQAVVNVHGLLTGGASCQIGDTYWDAGASLSVYYGATGLTNGIDVAFGMVDNDPLSPENPLETGEMIINLELANGTENQLMLHAFAFTTVSALQECTAEAKSDLGNTFTWMGVAAVTDSQGNPITTYTLTDEFGKDWTTPAPVADINIDGVVNVIDLLAVINAWGPCPEPCPPSCAADIAPLGGDCAVSVSDLLMVINNWGD